MWIFPHIWLYAVLISQALYGLFRAKLELITHAHFDVHFHGKMLIFVLFFHENICCVYPLEGLGKTTQKKL